MYEKNTYKCMKKTCIQKYEQNIQMYEKNRNTNVLKKHKSRKKQAHKCMKKICSYTGGMGSQLQRVGSMGVQCLSQGHLSRDKEVNCHASSCLPTNPFVEQWVGIEPPTLWLLDDQTHHCATANPNTNVKMYEKNRHKNVWKKQAYKCMTKTHTNLWKKQA